MKSCSCQPQLLEKKEQSQQSIKSSCENQSWYFRGICSSRSITSELKEQFPLVSHSAPGMLEAQVLGALRIFSAHLLTRMLSLFWSSVP